MSVFALLAHKTACKDGRKAPSHVVITECSEVSEPHGDPIARTKFWDCSDGARLTDSCRFQVMTGDFIAGGLPDVQYHFHGLDPDKAVRHAYSTAIYQFGNGPLFSQGIRLKE